MSGESERCEGGGGASSGAVSGESERCDGGGGASSGAVSGESERCAGAAMLISSPCIVDDSIEYKSSHISDAAD